MPQISLTDFPGNSEHVGLKSIPEGLLDHGQLLEWAFVTAVWHIGQMEQCQSDQCGNACKA
jgi:hypothetical protein